MKLVQRAIASAAAWLVQAPEANFQSTALSNGDFETRATKKDEIAGFVLSLGAQNGAQKPASEVTLDSKIKHGGKYSLKFSGTDTTRGWQTLEHQLAVRPRRTVPVRWKRRDRRERGHAAANAARTQRSRSIRTWERVRLLRAA